MTKTTKSLFTGSAEFYLTLTKETLLEAVEPFIDKETERKSVKEEVEHGFTPYSCVRNTLDDWCEKSWFPVSPEDFEDGDKTFISDEQQEKATGVYDDVCYSLTPYDLLSLVMN